MRRLSPSGADAARLAPSRRNTNLAQGAGSLLDREHRAAAVRPAEPGGAIMSPGRAGGAQPGHRIAAVGARRPTRLAKAVKHGLVPRQPAERHQARHPSPIAHPAAPLHRPSVPASQVPMRGPLADAWRAAAPSGLATGEAAIYFASTL